MISTRTQIVRVHSYDPFTLGYLYSFDYRWDKGTGLPAHGTIVHIPSDIALNKLFFNIETNEWYEKNSVEPIEDLQNKYHKVSQKIGLLNDMLVDEDYSIMTKDQIENELNINKTNRIELRRKIMEYENGAPK